MSDQLPDEYFFVVKRDTLLTDCPRVILRKRIGLVPWLSLKIDERIELPRLGELLDDDEPSIQELVDRAKNEMTRDLLRKQKRNQEWKEFYG